MPIVFVLIAGIAVIDLAYVLWRATAEWRRGDELSQTTGVFISTLYVLLAGLLVLAVAERPWVIDFPQTVAVPVGALLVIGGLALAAPGFVPFASVRQLYGVERGGLITEGVYRHSRNPQYVGIGVALLGAAVIARSGLALVVVVTYWVGIRAWLVVEEAHLQRAFGDEYAAYRERVPRFIGRPGEP